MTQWLDWRRMFARRREKIEITIETSESWEIRRFRQSQAERCPVCRAETIFIPPDLAAQIAQTSENAIEDILKNAAVHFIENAEKQPLICLSSLKKTLTKDAAQKYLKDE